MAAGTPIVARECEGGAELIEEYGTGFLYRPRDGVSHLVDKLIELKRDSTQYRALSDKCKRIAREDFSLQRFGERLLGLYGSIRMES
jgi:glycosyltransferase involved in cell wall biosynthesis